ncbi:hypothetical protein evm_003809, partial [Chilo suppressalis]
MFCQNCKKKGHATEACRSKNKKPNGKSNEKLPYMCLNTAYSDTDKNVWCLDSGCSSHMCGDKSMFTSMTAENASLKLASNKYSAEIKGKGKMTRMSSSARLVTVGFLLSLAASAAAIKCWKCGQYSDGVGSITPCNNRSATHLEECPGNAKYCIKYVSELTIVRDCVPTCKEK